ncbi:MAG TPA: hypothetical protein VLL75_07335 [Vicinamibacteria bacterium]|nr:hypothetical protein [Vicinamibacteria bacterium]
MPAGEGFGPCTRARTVVDRRARALVRFTAGSALEFARRRKRRAVVVRPDRSVRRAASSSDSRRDRCATQRRFRELNRTSAVRHRAYEILTHSRRVEKDLVAHIAEADERRLYAREAFPSMFAYCTEALHLSEAEAYLRIAAARASREHPMILAMLGDGRLHLTGIALLAPHLTADNRETLLRRATHRSKRQIEELIAEVAPQEDVPALMRRLPERTKLPAAQPPTPSRMGDRVTSGKVPRAEGPRGQAPVSISAEDRTVLIPAEFPPVSPDSTSVPLSPDAAPVSTWAGILQPLPPADVRPLAPGRYKVQFTATSGLHEKLERLRALMRSQVPDGDLGAIIEAAVTEKLGKRWLGSGGPGNGSARRRAALLLGPRRAPRARDRRVPDATRARSVVRRRARALAPERAPSLTGGRGLWSVSEPADD